MATPKGLFRLATRFSIPILGVLILAAGGGRPLTGQSIEEFPISPGAQPQAIAAGPGGMWFTGANGVGLVGAGGRVTEYATAEAPRGIVAGPDGNLWFTSDGFVSRMTPDGVVTSYVSDPIRQGPDGPLGPGSLSGWPSSIILGLDGRLWFADADIEGGRIGKIDVGGQIRSLYIQNVDALDPGWLTLDQNGRVWYATLGTYGDAGIGPAVFLQHMNVSFLAGVRGVGGLVAGADGNLWFTETNAPRVGRWASPGVMTEIPVTGSPRSITAGPDGSLWFTEPEANLIGHLSTQGVLEELPVPTAGARPWGIAAGADGNIWFTESGAGRIGRVRLVDENELSLAGGRYHASATWQSSTGSGEAHPVSLTADAGYFWFDSPANIELVVKLLDGCSLNDRLWLFAAGLTNVKVVLTVTDTQTHEVRTHTNPQGAAFLPIQDTAAFSTCP